MAATADLGSREMSEDDSNDDTISITSTVVSEQLDNYPLEGIWAERDNDGVMEYLVKWEGYPEDRNTWQTRDTFQEEEGKTFQDWETQKMRISRGYIKPFNVEAFEQRCLELHEASQKRKMRRHNKRIRMGLPVAPLQVADDEDDGNAREEYFEEPETINPRPMKRKRRLQRRSRGQSYRSESGTTDTDASPEHTMPTPHTWGSQQQSALISGLERMKGPHWTDILSMHRLILKDFTALDLENQARLVKNQFKESGREIPQYLKAVSDKPSTNMNIRRGNKTGQRSRTQSREQSIAKKSSDDETDTSVDSLMEDLTRENPARLLGQGKPATTTGVTDQHRKTQRKPRAQQPPKNDKSEEAKAAASIPTSKPTSATPRAQIPELRVATLQATARAPLSAASRPRPGPDRKPTAAPMGGIGRGPRRPKPLIAKRSYIPKTIPVTGNLLSNWDKGKVHGNSSLALKEPGRTLDKPSKAYDKHSIRRRTVVKGRTEPMPDVSSLHFIDPKDGKAVKEPVRPPSENIQKTPYQKIQESLKEALPNTQVANQQWMDEMDSEITVEPSMTAAAQPSETPQQAPVAPMKPVEAAIKRASMSFNAYMQRPQAPPPPPPPPPPQQSPSSPPPPPSAPTSATPKAPATASHSSPSTQPSKAGELAGESVQSPKSNLPTSATLGPPLQAWSATTGPQHSQGFQGTSNPIGLERIIADMRRGGEKFPQMSSHHVPNIQEEARPQTSNHHYPNTQEAHYQMSIKVESDVFADIFIGPEHAKIRSVKWRSLERPARQLMIRANAPPNRLEVWCSHMCAAADYEAHFHAPLSNYHGSGFVVPSSRETVAAVDSFSETLKLHISGGLFFSGEFTMLVYPVNSEEWFFLDQHFPPVPNVALRFVLRRPIQVPKDEVKDAGPRRQKIEKRMSRKGNEIHIPNEQGINTVMRLLYEIDYPRLIQQAPPRVSTECSKFFLLFPKEAKDEQDLVVQFLSANNALEIYTHDPNSADAAWCYFYQCVDAGVIIAHSSFWQWHLIPYLAQILRKPMNVWSLSLRKDRNMSHPHLTRLFPHGCMLLLTDSLILLRPHDAVRLLAWFRLKMLVDKPAGTWKIITRPGLRNFCLNCCNERADHEEGKRFVEIYREIVYMLDPDKLYDFDEDRPKDEAPLYCMPKIKSFNTKVGRRVDYNRDLDHAAIARNDEVLMEFFAGWAACHVEDYRRFHVVTGFQDDSSYGGKAARDRWVEKFSFLEIFAPEVFYTKIKVPTMDVLGELASKKHKEIIADYERKDAEIEGAMQKDEEDAREQEASRKREWARMCEGDPRLREECERLHGEMEGEWSDDEKGEVDGEGSEWDEWSDDGTSSEGGGEDVEMGEITGRADQDGDGDTAMLTPSEGSEIGDSEGSSSEDED